jgi:hypothetical protein
MIAFLSRSGPSVQRCSLVKLVKLGAGMTPALQDQRDQRNAKLPTQDDNHKRSHGF